MRPGDVIAVMETPPELDASTERAPGPDPRGRLPRGLMCVRGPLHKQRRADAPSLRWQDPMTRVWHMYVKTILRQMDGEQLAAEIIFFAYDGLEFMVRPVGEA